MGEIAGIISAAGQVQDPDLGDFWAQLRIWSKQFEFDLYWPSSDQSTCEVLNLYSTQPSICPRGYFSFNFFYSFFDC